MSCFNFCCVWQIEMLSRICPAENECACQLLLLLLLLLLLFLQFMSALDG